MTRKLVSLFLALLLLGSLSVSLAEEAAVPTDMTGREIVLNGPVERVVALTAADCEILCALGAENLLVGRGEYCDYPESVLELPAVASGSETNLEQILALNPQLVLTSTMDQTKEQVEALEKAGVAVAVSNAADIEGVYESIRMIGGLVDKNAEAETLIESMQSAFSAVAEKSENVGKTVYFEVSPLQWGLWTAGKGTFMDELASLCGLTNAFADVEGWAEISEEQVLERDPDYIVTISMYYGEGPTPVEEIKGRAGWDTLKAVVNDAVFNADSNEVSRPGPRLKEAVEALYQFVSGDEEALAPAA